MSQLVLFFFSVPFSCLELIFQDLYINLFFFFLNTFLPGPSFDLPDGTTTFPFTYQLKRLLPSTFRGSYGKIKYKIEFIVDKPWKFDEQYEVPLNIYKSFDLNLYPMYMSVPQQKQIARNIGYFGSGPITLQIFIPRSAYTPGEKLPLQVTVTNNSSTHVDKVKFSVRKIINYFSITPITMQKQEIIKILKKEAGGVDKKSEQKYEHMLLIPDLPATDEQASKIIHITYEIKVEVKLSGLYKNIIETIPLIIGSNSNSLNVGGITSSSGNSMPLTIIQQARSPPAIGFVRDDDRRQSISSNSHASVASSTFASAANASAPPLDFTSISPNSTRSSVYSTHWDAPPSYDDVFGSPSSSSRYSAYSSLNSSLRISSTDHTNQRRSSQINASSISHLTGDVDSINQSSMLANDIQHTSITEPQQQQQEQHSFILAHEVQHTSS